MYVVKRNGKQERVQFDKITSRISKLSYNLNMQFVDPGQNISPDDTLISISLISFRYVKLMYFLLSSSCFCCSYKQSNI